MYLKELYRSGRGVRMSRDKKIKIQFVVNAEIFVNEDIITYKEIVKELCKDFNNNKYIYHGVIALGYEYSTIGVHSFKKRG